MKQPKLATLEKPLYLLSFFSQEKPVWCLNELARASGVPKATCLRSIAVLIKYRLLQRTGDCYRLGTKLITLGSIVSEAFPPRQIAVPFLEKLRDETGQSVQWVIRDQCDGVYLDVYNAREPIRLLISPGRHAPLYAGASTRMLLAFAPPEIIEEVLRSRRVRYTAATPVEASKLRSLIRFTRRTWFASSFGELTPSTCELSAPIFDAGEDMVAAISVAGSEPYMRSEGVLEHLVTLLNVTAREISSELGYKGPWLAKQDVFLATLREGEGQ